jgi:fucose permease
MIGGAGFTGFCFGIIRGGVICDKIGYGKLVVAAFGLHVISALVAFGAMDGMATKTAFVYLWTGTFLFAVANGTLEAVANPLVATLFPNNRTHYLNILHASWLLWLLVVLFSAWPQMEVSNPGGFLWHFVPRPAFPEIRSIPEGSKAW